MPYNNRGYIEISKETKEQMEDAILNRHPDLFVSWNHFFLYIIEALKDRKI